MRQYREILETWKPVLNMRSARNLDPFIVWNHFRYTGAGGARYVLMTMIIAEPLREVKQEFRFLRSDEAIEDTYR